MRIKGVLFLGFFAVVIAAYFALKPVVLPEEEKPEPCISAECGPQGPTAEATLALRYAPIVYLSDKVTDCGETTGDFHPVPVEIVLGNQQVSLYQGRDAQPIAAPTAADLYNRGPETFLDLPGSPRRPGCRFVKDGQTFASGQPNIAYARITREEGFDELVLQYWLYYYFNQWNNKHESDWEMIQIIFEADSAEDALTTEPLRVAFSQHSTGELAQWDDEKLEREGDRPVLRVAAGSHSNRYTPHTFLGRGEQGFGCDEAEGQTRYALDPRLIPATISGPTDPYAWLTFQGRWGELAGPEFDGPTGPNMKTQWNAPLTWEEKLRNSSVRLPSRNTLGPSAIEGFCSIVDWGSNVLLPIYLQLPELTLALLGLAGVGMVMSLTRTQYWPIVREPLRIRRRFGQILLSSLNIYRANARLFIGIGLIFLPLTLSTSVIHWLVLNVSPVDPVTAVPRSDAGQEIVLAFVLSELQFGVAYAVVVMACIAALSAIDRNERAGVLPSYLAIWHNLRPMIPPRVWAVTVSSLLALTVVGIPLAIRQAVRWNFIEQAVLLDGKAGKDALDYSSATADRDWFWAAASTIVLGAVGLFAGPFIGILLLLLAQSIPLGDINLLTSVIHVALVPFVGIALALVYFDLRARQEK